MSDSPTTIAVKPWGEGQGDFVLINEADFDPAIHTRWVDPLDHDGDGDKGGAIRTDGPTIAEFVAAGYPAKNYPPAGYASKSTPEEIAAAIAAQEAQANAQNGGNGSDGGSSATGAETPPAVIPADWESLHHFKKIALAEALIGGDIEADGDKTVTQVAEDVIRAEVEKRASGTPAGA
jgi:hypothetical protein